MGIIESDAENSYRHLGRRMMCWQKDSSPVKSSVVTSTTLAPRATTSRMLDTVFSNSAGWVASATTSVPSSISEIVPCLSSPAAYASEWIYEISLSLSEASSAAA